MTTERVVDIKIKSFGDHFTGDVPEFRISGILFGGTLPQRVGKTEIKNHSTGEYA